MITITAATGHFGRLATNELLERGLPAGEIVAAVRNPEKAADLAERGVQVRGADYERPETLASAFKDADRILFISSSDAARQAEQHANVVQAATDAGASGLIYTSYLNADTSGIAMAQPHARTEQLIRQSGLPFAILPEYAKMLAGAGLPQFFADAIADNSAGAARGAWHTDSQDLQQLLGRPSTAISEAIAEALRTHEQRQA